MKLHVLKCFLAIAVLSALPLAAQAAPAAGKPAALAKAEFHPKTIAWTPQFAYRSASLRIAGPSGIVFDRDFGQDKPAFDLAATPYLADGQYVYEIVLGRMPDEALAKALSRAEFDEAGSVSDAGLAAKLGALRETVSGTFTISDGLIVSPYLVESPLRKGLANEKDIIHADDVIINGGSLCVGFDCVNGEVFGFQTLRLKENNTRLGFTDTSVSTFPANSWQLTANDSASGGANKFSIEDITGVKIPFTVTAGAATNSLFIDSTGRVGFRTSTPVLDLHARTSNTPGIRLEQDNSGGFTAQTWDMAANEANFFIRDVTGGSRLPFRIRPGAPTSSIDIASSGNVGIGTGAPISNGGGRELTVFGDAGFAALNLQTATSPVTAGVVRFYGPGTALKGQIAGALDGSMRFLTNGGVISEKMRILGSGNVGIGTSSPTAKLHVQGDVTVTGALHVSGPCCGPDYVFDSAYKLASIEDQAAYMWKNRHLPAVGAARTTSDGAAVVDVFSQSKGMLEELEKAHIYIEKLHREIQALRAEASERDAQVRAELSALRKRLDH